MVQKEEIVFEAANFLEVKFDPRCKTRDYGGDKWEFYKTSSYDPKEL